MAITVTDNRTLIDEADSTTGWSSPVSGEGLTVFTADPAPKEATGHIGAAVSSEESEILHTHTSTDLSAGVLVYIWAFGGGIMDTKALYGISGVLGDGTNTRAYQVAGGDFAVFRHSSGSNVSYQCLVLDTGSLPTSKALRGGALTNTAVTEFGANFKTTAKAVGGVENCFVDIIRYGNGGLTITGTESASRWMTDLATLDAASTNLQSYGICRDLGGGAFEFQGQILLGDTASGSDTLSVVNETFQFASIGVGTDKFGLTVQGGTGTQTFTFTDSRFIVPSGVGAFFTATDTDVENLDVTGCLFVNWDQGFSLTADATNGPNWDWSGNTFVGCSQINIGKTAFKDNTIDSTTDANGGMIIDANTSLTNVSGLEFVSDGTGHAVYITATGTYEFNNWTFTGYGADGTTDAAVFNDSGGAVTINITGGGDTPTVRDGTGASTTVNNAVTVSINVDDNTGANLENARVYVEAADGTGPLPFEESITITRSATTATVTHTAHGLVTNDYVNLTGITNTLNKKDNNGAHQITKIDADSYSYTTLDEGDTTYTGTITATGAVINGLTDVNGAISVSRTFPTNQPVRGFVRKSSSSPRFKSFSLAGNTIDSANGLTVNVRMVLDE